MVLTAADGDERLKYKVVSRATYEEVVKGARVVASDDTTGDCTLLVPKTDVHGYVELGADNKPVMVEQTYHLDCGIATIRT